VLLGRDIRLSSGQAGRHLDTLGGHSTVPRSRATPVE